MSTKTLLKRISLIAVVTLTAGTLSATTASAADVATVTSSNNAQTALIGAPAASTICVTGGNNDTLVLDPVATGATAAGTWSVSPQDNPSLVFSASSGTFTSANLTVTKSNASTQCFILTVTATAGANADTLNMSTSAPAIGAGVVNALTVTISTTTSATTETPWRFTGIGALDVATETTPSSISLKNVIESSTEVVKIKANLDTVAKSGAGNFRYVKIDSGTSAIAALAVAAGSSTMTLNGTLGTAQEVSMPQDGQILDNQVHFSVSGVGTVVVKFYDKTTDAITGFSTITTLQTITINNVAPSALDPNKSTSTMCANTTRVNATNGVASSGTYTQAATPVFVGYGDDFCLGQTANATYTPVDEVVIAPKAAVGTSNPTTNDHVAVIEVVLRDSTYTPIISAINPSIGAEVTGPGTVSISYAKDGASQSGSAGRNISIATPTFTNGTFYVNVFADGNGGVGKIDIKVGGSVWRTETISFYGAVSKVTATQQRYVLQDGSTAARPDQGCAGLLCDGLTVGNSVAVTLAATDALSIPVPYLKYLGASSDTTVLSNINDGATTPAAVDGDATVEYLGVDHFKADVPYLAAAGKSATYTFTTGTVSSNALTFALGGAAASVTMAITGGSDVGGKNAITVTTLDAAKNKAYDFDHVAKLTSNVVINMAVNSTQSIFTTAGATVPVWNGTGTVAFWNPIVPTSLVLGGTVGGAAVSATAEIRNASVDAAADAAAEAIDAANAATDAANLAAEAADAATVAAEEARDAADAATAAVEALATEVSALIAALKAQLTTLANTVAKMVKAQAKIAKKLNVKL